GIQSIVQAKRESLASGPGDHRTVVCAKLRWGRDQSCSDLEGKAVEDLPDRLICSNASGRNQCSRCSKAGTEQHQARPQPVEDDVDDCLLEARAKIGDILIAERSDFFRFKAQRGLQSRERKIGILATMHWTRQSETRCIAAGSFFLDLRSARKTKAKQLGGFVEGLANGIILRRAKANVIADAANSQDLGMPPGGEEQTIWECRSVCQPRRQGMRFKVIDGNQRFVLHKRDRLRGGQAYDHAADKPGSRGCGNSIDRIIVAARLPHGVGDHDVERFHVGARCNLRHYPAKSSVLADLRQHNIGQNSAAAILQSFNDRGGGLVARRLDAEDDHQIPHSHARSGEVTAGEIIASPDRWADPPGRLASRGNMAQSTASLRIGTRGSPLALVQARAVRARLAAAMGVEEDGIRLVVIRTTGDIIQDRTLAEEGGKGLFTKEIEEALLAGRVDLAVHSAKDMPTVLPGRLILAACLEREDSRDVFISRKARSLAELSKGASLGTASLRRQAIAMRARPDLRVMPLRGNVETRLRKLDAGEVDATLLALAGLRRLGLTEHATHVMSADEFLPAVGQGAIGIETRDDHQRIRDTLASIDHADTSTAVACERSFLEALDGSCKTPI